MLLKPSVFNPTATPPLQQMQTGDELDIPLDQRFERLRTNYGILLLWLVEQRFSLPEELMNYLMEVKQL
jgi:hypothetical protein